MTHSPLGNTDPDVESVVGRSDDADGLLLCSWHHHRAHDDRYLHSRLPNGDVRFHRRR